eukprot:1631587-Pleurochrysis_carterae.AAC.3
MISAARQYVRLTFAISGQACPTVTKHADCNFSISSNTYMCLQSPESFPRSRARLGPTTNARHRSTSTTDLAVS